MKKFLAFLLSFLMLFPISAFATWIDSTLPLDEIKDAEIIYKVVQDETNIIEVGTDIPAGLYGVSAFRFDNSPVLHSDYIIGVMRGTELIFQSEKLNTKANEDLIISVNDGETLLVIVSLGNVVYLYSVDAVCLKHY